MRGSLVVAVVALFAMSARADLLFPGESWPTTYSFTYVVEANGTKIAERYALYAKRRCGSGQARCHSMRGDANGYGALDALLFVDERAVTLRVPRGDGVVSCIGARASRAPNRADP